MLLHDLFFSENNIKSACLNTAQNLITDIITQTESFIAFTERLVDIRKDNSCEANPYGT